MTLNLLEGVSDKSDKGLRDILLAQAKVRVGVAIPVILTDVVLYFVLHSGVPLWFVWLTVGYAIYAVAPFLLTRGANGLALRGLLYASAISDPLVLSVWIALTGKFGDVIAGFYLFTTLGFGFRTGRPLMYLCQLASVCNFLLVLAFASYWQEHVIVWIALLVPLIVVPFYAGTLIDTLRLAREHAEQQSRAKSDLLAKVSHELRTPLTGIMATAELLAIEAGVPRVQRRTDTILSLSGELLNEINDLLDEAKYNSTGIHLARAPLDLREAVENLHKAFETMARKKNLALTATVDPALASLVNADAYHLNRVLFNLTGNAIKFTETGSVRIGVEIVAESADRYRLRFAVADTGIGIPESFRPEMFQPFSQYEQGSSRRHGGTGLGLSLSKRIVESMGGELRFESQSGAGSRFWFELDLERDAPLAAKPAMRATGTRSAPKRILLVEDNRTSATLIQELLTLDDHTVTVCDSGIAALERLTRESFDLLLLDYNLGDMDGTQVLRTYRFGRTQPAPAIFLTADATTQTATRLMEAGAVGIVHKPVNRANLREALARLVEPKPSATQASTTFAPAVPAPKTEVARLERPALRVVPVNALDENVLNELLGLSSSPGFFQKLLSQAEIDITRACKQLSDAFADRSYAIVPSVAHALKGVSANVGAIRLANLAGAMICMSGEDLDSSGDRLAADLRECASATVAALRRVVAAESSRSGGGASALHLD